MCPLKKFEFETFELKGIKAKCLGPTKKKGPTKVKNNYEEANKDQK